MNSKYTNYKTMTISLIAGVNTSLIAMNAYHLSNAQLQSADTLVSMGITFVGIVMSHKKTLIDSYRTFKGALKGLFKKSK